MPDTLVLTKWEFISRGLLYVVLCDSADGLWEEDVGAKVGVGKWLDASDTYVADVRLFLKTGEMHVQLIKTWVLIKHFEMEN